MTIAIRRLAAVAAVLALAGCAGVRRAPDVTRVPDHPETPKQAEERRGQAARPTYNLSGYPPAVKEGYIDGCESAKRTRHARRDAKRMGEDPQYAMGWNDGFQLCKK
ncbi:MAG TPA: hypothetical protein VFP36_03960 [Usitatibacter sp.]|nr:hypothetical protein [Usitatibacter sp.]